MPATIVDTPQPVQRFLPRMGAVTAIIRYITTSQSTDKCIKPAEAKAIAAAGKQLGIVFETWGDYAHAGRGGISGVDGMRDGKFARAYMPKLGAPRGACVYFAVDVDAPPANINKNILPYFKAISEQFADGQYRVGIYGPGAACQAVITAGYADLGWLSNAKGWQGYKKFLPSAALVQSLPTHMFNGLDVDPDTAQIEDWGQFTPFADDAAVEDQPADEVEVPTRLGQGDDGTSGMDYTAIASVATTAVGAGGFDKVKSLFKSKIAWLSGGLGGGAATATATSDPATSNLIVQLVEKPMFWLSILCIVLAGVIVYLRWKDHGRGTQ